MLNVRRIRRFVLGCGMLIAVVNGTISVPCSAAEPSIDPRLKALVEKHLRADPSYQPGDIISRGNVEPIYAELLALGIQPFDDHERAYNVFLRDGEFLVQLLRSPQGRKFMREAGGLPDAYDRMERLSWMPAGRVWLQQMVAAPNGAELFANLLTEDGVKSVEEALKGDLRGQNFRFPTGHLHSEADLLAHLQETLAARNRKPAAGE